MEAIRSWIEDEKVEHAYYNFVNLKSKKMKLSIYVLQQNLLLIVCSMYKTKMRVIFRWISNIYILLTLPTNNSSKFGHREETKYMTSSQDKNTMSFGRHVVRIYQISYAKIC